MKALDDLDANQSQIVQSTWIANFLNQKRQACVVSPPSITVANDVYLRQFNNQFSSIEAEEHDTSDVETETFIAVDKFYKTPENDLILSPDKILIDPEDGSVVNPEILDDSLVISNIKLRLFNLPYSISETEITKIGLKHGFEFVSVTIEMDQRKLFPSGSASIELPPGLDKAFILDNLQEKDFGGRPVRVQMANQKKRKSGGNADNRYFIDDVIDIKCKNCGEVGHMARVCTEVGMTNPCHLCAGRDHEAGTLLREREK
jgi:ribosomal protein L32